MLCDIAEKSSFDKTYIYKRKQIWLFEHPTNIYVIEIKGFEKKNCILNYWDAFPDLSLLG